MKRLICFAVVFLYATVNFAAVNVTVNGVTHVIPQTGERGWGTNVTAWIQAISANTLQPSGGTFTLTADTYFGATYGLRSQYFKSASTPISTTGILRLANNEGIGWRNAADSANYLLKVNASNQLEFNGSVLGTAASGSFEDAGFNIYDNGDTTKKIAFQASGITTGTTRTITVPDADVNLGALTNSNIDASAAIAYSKLALTTSIVNGDISGSAAIARSKLASGTASHVVINDGSGNFSSEAQLSSTRGGTGVNNAGTLTYGSNNLTFTTSGATNVTLPTSGTLAAIGGNNVWSGTNQFTSTLSGSIVADSSSGADQTLSTPTKLVVRSTGALTSIVGFTAPSSIEQVFVWTNATGSTVVVKNESASATAANRILTGTGADINVKDAASLLLFYDTSSSRWRLVGGSGGGSTQVDTITGSTVITNSYETVICNSTSALTVTLPTAVNNTGKTFLIKNRSTGAVTIDANSTETIDGQLTQVINIPFEAIKIVSDGSNWFII